MTRERYQARLATLRAEVNEMAETTLARYRAALDVLETGDADAASRVIEGDADINDLYLELEGDCIELVALQQPVAGDLRFVASSFKILTDLERIGDLATNLARYGRESGGGFEAVDVQPLGQAAGEMVADAMAAYADDDSDAARAVAARDDDLDSRCRAASETVVRRLLATPAAGLQHGNGHIEEPAAGDDPAEGPTTGDEHADGPADREPHIEGLATGIDGLATGDLGHTLTDVRRALLTIRDIERVGDHAVNICARTVYMVEHDDDLIY